MSKLLLCFTLLFSILFVQNNLIAQEADVYIYDIQWDTPVSTTSPTSLSMTIDDYTYPDGLMTLDFKLYVDGDLVQTDSDVVIADLPSDRYGYATVYVTEYEFSADKDSVEIWIEIDNPDMGELEFSTYSQTISNQYNRQFVYLPLPGGTYSIDSTDGDFPNLTAASFALNQRGITSDVILNVSPGVYEDTPFGIQGNLGSKVTVRKDPAQSGEVVIEYEVGKGFEETRIEKGTKTQNGEAGFYPQGVVTLSQTSDVHFENMSFVATEANGYDPEVAVYMDGCQNISFDNCTFEVPMANSLNDSYAPFYGSSRCVHMYYCNEISFKTDNHFKGGELGLVEYSFEQCDREIEIEGNTFENQFFRAIHLENYGAANCSTYKNNSNIRNNTFSYSKSEMGIGFGGTDSTVTRNASVIYSKNGTFVGGNGMSGFEGDGTEPASSLVTIDHDPGTDDDIDIVGNSFENVEDMNGINITGVGSGQ